MDNKKASALLSMIEFEHAECCLNTWYKGIDDDMKEALEMAIEALEQTRWIPVSERLPERDVDVLTYHRNESYDYQYVSWIDDYSGEWAGFIGSLFDEVLAWMPLPQPCKGEKGGE